MCVCERERERERELHQTNKMGKKARAFFLVDPHNLISMQQNVVNNRPKHKKNTKLDNATKETEHADK